MSRHVFLTQFEAASSLDSFDPGVFLISLLQALLIRWWKQNRSYLTCQLRKFKQNVRVFQFGILQRLDCIYIYVWYLPPARYFYALVYFLKIMAHSLYVGYDELYRDVAIYCPIFQLWYHKCEIKYIIGLKLHFIFFNMESIN